MRTLKKALYLSAGCMIVAVAFLILLGAHDRMDAEAKAAGFANITEQRKALKAGITDPAAWASRMAGEQAARKRDNENQELIISACVRAERAVKERLKAPATATFPDCFRQEVRATPDRGTVYVKGYVDSQNSFGAMLRSTFVVKLQRNGGGPWTVMAAAVE